MGNRAKKLIMLCVLLAGCALIGFYTYSTEENNEADVKQLIAMNKEAAQEQTSRTMKIYVSGAVMAPGIYDIPFGVRAYDAVAAAGGMTDYADADRVNLAKKLKDGDHVNVPAMKNSKSRGREANTTTRTIGRKNDTVNVQAYNEQNTSSVININTADQKELESLPGIGPAMAKRIISERNKQSFNSVDDLLRVKGIGSAKLAKLRDRVKVN